MPPPRLPFFVSRLTLGGIMVAEESDSINSFGQV